MQFVSPSNFNRFNSTLGNGAAYYWEASPGALIPPAFSLTRPDPGTYYDSAGLLQTAAIDVTRGTYRWNGSAWVFDGTIVEAAATQLVTPTASIRDLTNAAWVKTNMTTALTSTGADGAANSATRCTASTGNATALQTLVAAATSRTVSFLMRRVTGTGAIHLTQDGVTFTTDISSLLNNTTYTLVQLNATQLNASFGFRLTTSGDAIDVDFAQFEAGNGATSRIATAGVTRAADVLTAPVSGLLVNGQGLAAIGFRAIDNGLSAGAGSFISTFAGSEGMPLNLFSGAINFYDGAAFRAGNALASLTPGTAYKMGSTWGGSSGMTALNGTSSASLTFDGSMTFGATIRIGDNVAAVFQPISMVLQSLRLGQSAASSGQLANMTA